MARWKLTAAHYLRVPGTTWEYKEVDRKTNRPKRVSFDVPQLLDPTQEIDWTEKDGEDGIVVVCLEGKGNPTDVPFLGNPTPDMVPLDDEARAISAKALAGLKHPINDLAPSYAEGLIQHFQKEMSVVKDAVAAPAEGMTELLTAMAQMMKQNQELIAVMAKAQAPAPALKRA